MNRIAGLSGSDGRDDAGGAPDEPGRSKASRVLADIRRDAIAQRRGFHVELTGLPSWEILKCASGELRSTVLLAAFDEGYEAAPTYEVDKSTLASIDRALISRLFKMNLPLTEQQLTQLAGKWLARNYIDDFPGVPFLGAVERYSQAHSEIGDLRLYLQKIRDRILGDHYSGSWSNQRPKIEKRLTRLLDRPAAGARVLPAGDFATQVLSWINEQAENQQQWLALFAFAATSADKSQPSIRWLNEAKPLITTVGELALVHGLVTLLEQTTPDGRQQRVGAWLENTGEPCGPDESLTILKGLLWMTTLVPADSLAGPVGRFAERCFRKVPGVGLRSAKLGNAALWALSEMPIEPHAAAELFRLRGSIKYPSVRANIQKRLTSYAEKNGGVDLADLEDASLPHFGLDSSGRLTKAFGETFATVEVTAAGVATEWTTAAGKRVKSAPASVRQGHKPDYKTFQQQLKDLDAARSAQARRLEDAWLEDRQWTYEAWSRSHLNHPLRRQLAKALVWKVDDGGDRFTVMPSDDGLRDLAGALITPTPSAVVRLWHPVDASPDEVRAWRRDILTREITQPIKQAHREIYVLTDAERTTRIYSNRFAAHILRQHQFRALCQARGWRYEFQGGWDSANTPHRSLPNHELFVQFYVEPVDGERTQAYIPLYLATDQVRFIDLHGEALELAAISPIVFSECLRDVDLFVAVTSVANDPNWTDGGPEGRFRDYWSEYAFGELGQSAQTRRELLAAIAPKLSIADKLEIADKFLIVQGQLHKYAIHFGSSNIQILPSNRYLCIVPKHDPDSRTSIKLPFLGDTLLSTILSKAFLLADEREITDATILSQLRV